MGLHTRLDIRVNGPVQGNVVVGGGDCFLASFFGGRRGQMEGIGNPLKLDAAHADSTLRSYRWSGAVHVNPVRDAFPVNTVDSGAVEEGDLSEGWFRAEPGIIENSGPDINTIWMLGRERATGGGSVEDEGGFVVARLEARSAAGKEDRLRESYFQGATSQQRETQKAACLDALCSERRVSHRTSCRINRKTQNQPTQLKPRTDEENGTQDTYSGIPRAGRARRDVRGIRASGRR